MIQLIDTSTLREKRLAIAAAFGSPNALGALPINLPDHFRTQIELAVALLPADVAVRFACECAERVLDRWETLFPSDLRPRRALEAARLWLEGVGTSETLEVAWRGAADASIENDDTSTLPENHPELTAALHAADAASHAALAGQLALRLCEPNSPLSDFDCNAVGYCARFSTHAARDEDAEMRWQKSRMAELLLEAETQTEQS